jgi:hypothetical protein
MFNKFTYIQSKFEHTQAIFFLFEIPIIPQFDALSYLFFTMFQLLQRI